MLREVNSLSGGMAPREEIQASGVTHLLFVIDLHVYRLSNRLIYVDHCHRTCFTEVPHNQVVDFI